MRVSNNVNVMTVVYQPTATGPRYGMLTIIRREPTSSDTSVHITTDFSTLTTIRQHFLCQSVKDRLKTNSRCLYSSLRRYIYAG